MKYLNLMIGAFLCCLAFTSYAHNKVVVIPLGGDIQVTEEVTSFSIPAFSLQCLVATTGMTFDGAPFQTEYFIDDQDASYPRLGVGNSLLPTGATRFEITMSPFGIGASPPILMVFRSRDTDDLLIDEFATIYSCDDADNGIFGFDDINGSVFEVQSVTGQTWQITPNITELNGVVSVGPTLFSLAP